MKTCIECGGDGTVECSFCIGNGEVINTCDLGYDHEEDCPDCNGKGYVDCEECAGTGEIDDGMAPERDPDYEHDNV